MNRQHPRVLIVEDDPMASVMFRKLFETWFWEARAAFTVAEAIEALSVPLDLVMLDLQLPDGSGAEVLRAIRDRKLAMPVIVATARGIEAIDEVKVLKPDHFLEKPFAYETMRFVAERIFAGFKPAKTT